MGSGEPGLTQADIVLALVRDSDPQECLLAQLLLGYLSHFCQDLASNFSVLTFFSDC